MTNKEEWAEFHLDYKTPNVSKKQENTIEKLIEKFNRSCLKKTSKKIENWAKRELRLLKRKALAKKEYGPERTARLIAGLGLLEKAVETMGALPFSEVALALAKFLPLTLLTGKKSEWSPWETNEIGDKISCNKRFPNIVKLEDGTISDRVSVLTKFEGCRFRYLHPLRTSLPKAIQGLMTPLKFPLYPPSYKMYAEMSYMDEGLERWDFKYMEDIEGKLTPLCLVYKYDRKSNYWERIG